MGLGDTHSVQRFQHAPQESNIEVYTNSPANLTGIDSWNSLSSHIVHATNGTGNGFTGDGWTANTRTRRD